MKPKQMPKDRRDIFGTYMIALRAFLAAGKITRQQVAEHFRKLGYNL
ncbi:MAG: hypothetical protein ABIL58_20085 [Pseudomonadota bacterium]